MAKSKNYTAHNQSYKAHRNDIKKPRKHRHTSTKAGGSLVVAVVPVSLYLQ
ncbi:putative ribosomal protein L29e [Helianthus anomalus]